MATSERFQTGGARSIARFLSEHQHCDDGFDVQRGDEDGFGRLRITCLGCGQSVAYKSGEPGEFAIADVESNLGNGAVRKVQQEAVPSRPVPDVPKVAPPRRVGVAHQPPEPERSEGPRLPRWVPAALISLVIVAGLAMIAIGLLRSGDDGGEEQAATPPPAQSAPEPAPSPEPAPPAGEQPAPAPQPEPAPAVKLDRQAVADTFEIGVPAGWRAEGNPTDGFTFAPPTATAGVSVFFEPGETELAALARLASGFLADRHPGARLSAPRPARLASEPALKVRAVYGGGTESAVVTNSGGYSFLVLTRVDRGADARRAAEASAAAKSVKPL